tara:strand:- start:267 stop:461 length:195 start_codon:yes stop_codon:yes gene_type:complete
MLRLSRHVQQAIVINPVGEKDKPLVIRVLDLVPNTVGLGFEEPGKEKGKRNYEIIRAEIYKGES